MFPRGSYEHFTNPHRWTTYPVLEVRRILTDKLTVTGIILARDVENDVGRVYDGDVLPLLAFLRDHIEVVGQVERRPLLGAYLNVEEMVHVGWEPDDDADEDYEIMAALP